MLLTVRVSDVAIVGCGCCVLFGSLGVAAMVAALRAVAVECSAPLELLESEIGNALTSHDGSAVGM